MLLTTCVAMMSQILFIPLPLVSGNEAEEPEEPEEPSKLCLLLYSIK